VYGPKGVGKTTLCTSALESYCPQRFAKISCGHYSTLKQFTRAVWYGLLAIASPGSTVTAATDGDTVKINVGGRRKLGGRNRERERDKDQINWKNSSALFGCRVPSTFGDLAMGLPALIKYISRSSVTVEGPRAAADNSNYYLFLEDIEHVDRFEKELSHRLLMLTEVRDLL
jgi:hypothetical protein